MTGPDTLQPFYFERLPVRGALVRLGRTHAELIAAHAYPGPVARLLGEGAAATSLIASSLKFSGRLTLQITGSGPMPMFVLQSTHTLALRGMALLNDAKLAAAQSLDFGSLTQGSRCSLAVESRDLRERYQGIVRVEGRTLAGSLEHYFRSSVQVPTRLQLLAGDTHSGGMILQIMDAERRNDIADDWRRLELLARTMTLEELVSQSGISLLRRIFSEDDLRVPSERTVQFRCDCSRDRAARAVTLLGEADARLAVAEQGVLTVTCEFCAAAHRLDAIDVAALFSGSGDPASPKLH